MPGTIVRGRFGRATVEQKVLWAPIYEEVLTILGSTGVIIPMGDTNHENSGRTTVTTVGEEAAVFTYSEAVTAFDAPPSLLGPGRIPTITFNGTDEEADSPDASFWSRVGAAFSVGAWVNLTDATSSVILSKYDAAGNTREWVFWLDASDKLQLILYDESVSADPTIDTEADSTLTQSTWVFVAATYDGSADASGISVYQDGALVASTDTDDAAFVNLEDLAGTVKLGHLDATPASLFDGLIAGGPLGPFFTQTELSADAMLRLYQLGRAPLNV